MSYPFNEENSEEKNINYAQYASWSDHLKQQICPLELNIKWLQLDEERLRYLSEK
jgi:hypothetical protein